MNLLHKSKIHSYQNGIWNVRFLSASLRLGKNHKNENAVQSLRFNHVGSKQRLSEHISGTIPKGGNGIAISHYAKTERIFTNEDVEIYGQMIGDMNPIHLKNKEGDDSLDVLSLDQYHDKPIVHGMLLSSLFSCIFGSLIPGSVYRKQTLYFHKPVFTGELVVGQVKVVDVKQMRIRSGYRKENQDSLKRKLGGLLVTCETQIMKKETSTLRDTEKSGELQQKDYEDVDLVKCVTGQAEVWLPGVIAS